MQVPSFSRIDGKSLVYDKNDGSVFEYYVPEDFFSNTKVFIAAIDGQYVTFIGICNYQIVNKSGKVIEFGTFDCPTMVMCKPYEIEKVKHITLGNAKEASDYRVLRFGYNDEIISELRVPQMTDNVEIFFKLAVLTAKIPNTIPYDKIWEIFIENGRLNGFSYNLNAQLFGIIVRAICRDKNNIKVPFSYTDMKDMHDYRLISILKVPNYISPYVAATSQQNFDEHLRSAILMRDIPDEELPNSPIEKIVTQ